MQMIFKKNCRGTMELNPDGVFVTNNNNKVRIRKNAKKVDIQMGEELIEMWDYEEWVGTTENYMDYSNDLFNLPSNQLRIMRFCDCIQHNSVEVIVKNEDMWEITMYRNEIEDEGEYRYERLIFERPIKNPEITAEMVRAEYEQYIDSMFEFCEYPESPIQANQTSAVALMDMIINLKIALDDSVSEITTMKTQIENLESGV